jgi:hypothetical protein
MFKMAPALNQAPAFDAFDTIAGQTVLPKRSGIRQMVRVDQTQLLAFLNSQYIQTFGIYGTLSTNRTVGGAGGLNATLPNNFFRKSSILNAINEQEVLNDLAAGRADQKISALNQLVFFVQELRNAKPANGQAPPSPLPFIQTIHKARTEPLPAVSAWAAKCEFDVSQNPLDQANIVNDLAADADWRHRQVALLLANQVPPSVRDPVLTALSDDLQASVRAAARAMRGQAAVPAGPTTLPTTAPVVAPTTAP